MPLPSSSLLPGARFGIALALGATLLLLARVTFASTTTAAVMAATWVGLIAVLAAVDAWRSLGLWRTAGLVVQRRLPAALALGVRRRVEMHLALTGPHAWSCRLFDHMDASLHTHGMPVHLELAGGRQTVLSYEVEPTRRGEVWFAPAELWVCSRWRLWELRARCGPLESRRVYPDFAALARFAWLAGDRRLAEIGIKTFQQRGEGTEFEQLAEYRIGDSLRHLDGKATLRLGKPIVRQFQDERDQSVLLLLDCGRRMRAAEDAGGHTSCHFDQVLNAAMLLSYVALKQGDAVGALTFGTPVDETRWFAPRKGAQVLNALMGELYDVQPTPTHADFLLAAQECLRRQKKRALLIIITNFRDEDVSELNQALTLLRSRHLVLVASLRERVVRELATQPLTDAAAVFDVASAHLYSQARSDAFRRIAGRHGLLVDAEPQQLGVELVNRYQAVKRAGMI